MKNTQHFGDLTPRMEHFREELLETEPQVCAQRAILQRRSGHPHHRIFQGLSSGLPLVRQPGVSKPVCRPGPAAG